MTTSRLVSIKTLLAGGALAERELLDLFNPQTLDPVERELIVCSGEEPKSSIERRIGQYKLIAETLENNALQVDPLILWSHYIPLAELLLAKTKTKRTSLIGIVGLPGTGKSHLATILCSIACKLSHETVATVSLDDFYLPPDERRRRGYKWRAVPGSHDLDMLSGFLTDVREAKEKLSIPRYDTRAEVRREPLVCSLPKLLLFEGWFVGAKVPGYELLARALDHLVYLDSDLDFAYRSRVRREAAIRVASSNKLGMSAAETEDFWREAILPGAKQWVLPLKNEADIVIRLDEQYCFTAVGCRNAE